MLNTHNISHSRMVLLHEPFAQICATVGREPAETGGILLGSRDDFIVRKFIYDPFGSRSPTGYDPNIEFINRRIKEEWATNQLALLGFIHSHPRGIRRLSGDWGNGFGDLGYLKRIFSAIPALRKFLVPIVYSKADGGELEFFPYIAYPDSVENYEEAVLIVKPDYITTHETGLGASVGELPNIAKPSREFP